MSSSRVRRSSSRPLGIEAAGPPARAAFQHLAFGSALALALIALPVAALAGDKPMDSPETGTESVTPTYANSGPSAAGYKPRILGLSRYRKAARASKAGSLGVAQVECPQCDPLAPYVPESFHHSNKINNFWMPLQPGKQLVLQGVANRGGGLLEHHVIFTVTDLIKVINGIPCVVVWDQDINQGVLSESELAFFAQSDDGAVYNSGEYPEVYELGQFVDAENTWIHGIEWARAGVHVEANPVVGKGYEEANAPENDFWDCGRVVEIQSRSDRAKPKVCVPAGCFQDIMTVREWAPLDGCDVIQVKTYAKGIGIIQVGAIDDPEGETLVLTQINQLNNAQMDAARASALALDAHGPQVNEIYYRTQPAFRDRSNDPSQPIPTVYQTGDESAGVSARAFLAIGRNPVKGSTSISYGLAEEGAVDLAIYDVVGRRIRSLVGQSEAAGSHTVQWDGRDDSGSSVARGVYFARLRAGTQTFKKTLVIAP